MKETRFIVVEVQCDVEFDEGKVFVTSEEWERLDEFKGMLHRTTNGWVTRISSFYRTDPRKVM